MPTPFAPEPLSLPADSPLLRPPGSSEALRDKVQTMRHQGIDDERIVQTLAFDGVAPEETWALIETERALLAHRFRRSTVRWALFGLALCTGGYLLRVRFGVSKSLGVFLAVSAMGLVVGLLVYLTSLWRSRVR